MVPGSGSGDRKTGQSWSRAICDAFGDIHGLRYASAAHGYRVAYVFYDRARPFLESEPRFYEPLNHPQLVPILDHIADVLGYNIV